MSDNEIFGKYDRMFCLFRHSCPTKLSTIVPHRRKLEDMAVSAFISSPTVNSPLNAGPLTSSISCCSFKSDCAKSMPNHFLTKIYEQVHKPTHPIHSPFKTSLGGEMMDQTSGCIHVLWTLHSTTLTLTSGSFGKNSPERYGFTGQSCSGCKRYVGPDSQVPFIKNTSTFSPLEATSAGLL